MLQINPAGNSTQVPCRILCGGGRRHFYWLQWCCCANYPIRWKHPVYRSSCWDSWGRLHSRSWFYCGRTPSRWWNLPNSQQSKGRLGIIPSSLETTFSFAMPNKPHAMSYQPAEAPAQPGMFSDTPTQNRWIDDVLDYHPFSVAVRRRVYKRLGIDSPSQR